ncbi:MAG: diguanylate cyclase [Acidobacteria bacterium]|nr:diguanylate cyclase [Acidobacteriota bacterium]
MPAVCSKRLRTLLAIAAMLPALSSAQEQSETPSGAAASLRIITIAEVIRDSNGDTIPDRLGEPVHVRGTVTIGSGVVSQERLHVYFQDETAGTYAFSIAERGPNIPPGALIDVVGTVDQYRGAIQINRPRVAILGQRELPEPLVLTLQEAAQWKHYGKLVTVRGSIGTPVQLGPYVGYDLQHAGSTMRLALPPGVLRDFAVTSVPPSSEVSVTGVVTIYSENPPHNDGFQLMVGSPSWISVQSKASPIGAWVNRYGKAVAFAITLLVLLLLAFGISRRKMRLRKEQADTLSRVGLLAAAATDPDAFLADAIDLLIRNELVDGVVVHLLERGRLRLHASYGAARDKEKQIDEQVQSRLSGTIHNRDLPISEFQLQDRARDERLYPLVCVALQGRTRAVGVITALSTTRHALTPREASMIASVANLIALGIENVQMMLDHDEKNRELEQQAISDPLTGLYNRRFVDEYLRIHMAMARRRKTQVSFIAIDLDHFKKVNDTYGHARGDEILVRVAHVIRDTARTSDLTVRTGGEEFLVAMTDTGEAGALIYANRLQKELRIQHYEEVSMPITVSIGIAVYPDHGEEVGALLRIADESLYASKRLGRDRITVGSGGPRPLPD